MTVDRISKDGLVTISSVEVDGRNYDLPPWIPEADFVAGLRSGDDDNGLSGQRSETLTLTPFTTLRSSTSSGRCRSTRLASL
jgi:hypothetical protein